MDSDVTSELQQFFKSLDMEQTGYVTRDEFYAKCRRERLLSNDDALEEIFTQLDGDGDGRVSFNDFLRVTSDDVIDGTQAAVMSDDDDVMEISRERAMSVTWPDFLQEIGDNFGYLPEER